MTPDQMLDFESKNLWDCYFPVEPAKRIIYAPGDEVHLTDCRLNFATTVDIGSNSIPARASAIKTWLCKLGQTQSPVTHRRCAAAPRDPTWASVPFTQMESDRRSFSVSAPGCSAGLWFRTFPTAEQKAVLCKTNQQTGNLNSVMKA